MVELLNGQVHAAARVKNRPDRCFRLHRLHRSDGPQGRRRGALSPPLFPYGPFFLFSRKFTMFFAGAIAFSCTKRYDIRVTALRESKEVFKVTLPLC